MSAAVPIPRFRVHTNWLRVLVELCFLCIFPFCVYVWLFHGAISHLRSCIRFQYNRHHHRIKSPCKEIHIAIIIVCAIVCVRLCLHAFHSKTKNMLSKWSQMKSNVFHCTSSHTCKIFKPIAQRDRAGSLFNDSNVHSEISGRKFALTLLSCRIKHSN